MTEKKNQNQQATDEQPQNPQELISALKKKFTFPINAISNAQLEARMMAELEIEAWQGKRPESNQLSGPDQAPLCWRGYVCGQRGRAPHDDE
jgi:hypothetical protein